MAAMNPILFLLLLLVLLPITAVSSMVSVNNALPSPNLSGKLNSPRPTRILLSNSTSSSLDTASSDHGKVGYWILAFFIGILAGTFTGLVAYLLFRLLKDCVTGRFRNSTGPAIFSPLIRKADDLAFLDNDDGVAELQIIGSGGCGEVYRAFLPRNPGKLIAIKKIKKLHVSDPSVDLNEEESKLLEKGMQQLRSEIKTVGHIRHRNLLPLLAHVPRPDCNYLVYEYMKNGSLQDALKRAKEEGSEEQLPWPTRLKIARGIAAGLDYLHNQHTPRIIHRDLKPANILLDDDFEPRIADFGLAKALPDANTHMTTSNVAGTVGYIAPEYHQMLKLTDKCDIYSFGVILAVLVTGKMPTDDFFQHTEESSLVRWMRSVMARGDEAAVEEAIDERLRENDWEEEMKLVLKLACFCTVDDPKERPSSKDVRSMLDQIKDRQ